MSQYYDIGLQVGLKLSKEIDNLIEKCSNNESNMNPLHRKVLEDSVVYHWNMKWEPYRFSDERELVSTLRKYKDSEEKGYAYKLVARGDEGGMDDESNDIGFDEFDGLYHGSNITFPCSFDDETINKMISKPRLLPANIIDLFEDFLEKKGITIENEDKKGDDGEAIIFGEDFDDLMNGIINIFNEYNISIPFHY